MEKKTRWNWVKILIVAVPVWLLVSGGVGLWLHFHYQEKERQEQPHAYRKDINAASLVDDFTKITEQIGPRHTQTEEARTGLHRMAAMIDGALGTSNIGYEVQRIAAVGSGDGKAPLFLMDVLRRTTSEEIWLVVPYDSTPEMSRGSASASAVAVSFAVAQSLIGQPLDRNVRILYVPSAYSDEQMRMDTAAQVQRLIASTKSAAQVLVLGTMLHEGELVALMRQSGQPLSNAGKLVKVSEDAAICLQGDGEFSALLHEMNLPSALLFKMPEQQMAASLEDGIKAPATVLAESAGQVVQVLRHLASQPQKK
jgi:hypothetical protein